MGTKKMAVRGIVGVVFGVCFFVTVVALLILSYVIDDNLVGYDQEIRFSINLKETARIHKISRLSTSMSTRLPASTKKHTVITTSTKFKQGHLWPILAATRVMDSFEIYDTASGDFRERVVPPFKYESTLDARIFSYMGKDYVLYCARSQHLYDVEAKRHVSLTYRGMAPYERNWSRLPDHTGQDRLLFVARLRPLMVLECVSIATGDCVCVQDNKPGWRWDGNEAFVRGCTNLLQVPGKPKCFVAVGHTGHKKLIHNLPYRLLLYALVFDDASDSYKIAHISHMLEMNHLHRDVFRINKKRLIRFHFAAGLDLDEESDVLTVTGDVFDRIPIALNVDNWRKIFNAEAPTDEMRMTIHTELEKRTFSWCAVAELFAYNPARLGLDKTLYEFAADGRSRP
jgi:hypothetical protein